MSAHRTYAKIPGFRVGIYVFKDAEIVDFAAPYGVFSVARRFDPELDAFLVADALRPVQAQAGFTVVPNYSFADLPDMNAFLIPGGFGTRQEMHNGRLHDFIRALPEKTLITSVCTGSWIYGAMGLLDGKPATNRKEPDRVEASGTGKVPIDRLAEIAPACRISRARVVDAGRIVTAGGIASGMEMGFHLLRRAGYDEAFISEVARGDGIRRRLRRLSRRHRIRRLAGAPRKPMASTYISADSARLAFGFTWRTLAKERLSLATSSLLAPPCSTLRETRRPVPEYPRRDRAPLRPAP